MFPKKKTTTLNQFYGKATNRFLKNVSRINFHQCPLSGVLKTLVSPLWRTSFIDQDGTLFADIFIKYRILNILFCVEIVKKNFFSLLLKAFSNRVNVIFLEEVK